MTGVVLHLQANGNVPLVSLLRAAGALGRLPKELPLETIIDSAMEYVRRLKQYSSMRFVPCPFQRGDSKGNMHPSPTTIVRQHCQRGDRAKIQGERERGDNPRGELRGCFHYPEKS